MADDVLFEDNSEETLREMEDRIRIALREVGREAEGIAKELITQAKAVDTGRLRNSVTYGTADRYGMYSYTDDLHHVFGQEIKRAPKYTCFIGTNVEYAPYIEYGHHSYTGVHFLKRAAGNYTERYKKIIEKIMKE